MTDPTQAQIDAAAKAICDYRHYPDTEAWMNLGELQGDYRTMAEAALTAAAQVGEDRAAQKIIEPIIKDAITTAVNLTIERCAQVAETWKNGGSTESGGIAAAIRKLKDAP